MSDLPQSTSSNSPLKFAKPSPHSGVSLPLGAHPGQTGGKKGRSGRLPNAFKDFLQSVRDDPKARAALVKAASDPKCRNFGIAWKIVTDYDEDKPVQKQQIQGDVTVTVRIEREGRRIEREPLALVG